MPSMAKSFLTLLAHHGRLCLVGGLLAGLFAPGLAAALKPWLPHMVAGLVTVSALRIGHNAALGGIRMGGDIAGRVLALQVAAPILVITALNLFGLNATTVGLSLALALAGPSISGGPAITAMMGFDPTRTMQLLLVGTLLLPVTILPVLWLQPAIGGFDEVLLAALRLCGVIVLAAGTGFALRAYLLPDPDRSDIEALDGLSALALAIIVVGLMSAVGPALRDSPHALVGWLALAFAVNFGMQAMGLAVFRSIPEAIVAGNRNIALFLVALPATVIDPVLVFIGCYQIPMYLTPVILGRFYRGYLRRDA